MENIIYKLDIESGYKSMAIYNNEMWFSNKERKYIEGFEAAVEKKYKMSESTKVIKLDSIIKYVFTDGEE